MNRSQTVALLALVAGCAKGSAATVRIQPTHATLDVLHADVTVVSAAGARSLAPPRARIELDGRVVTAASGRAIVRTDDGLELRLAGDTEITFHDGQPTVEHGRAFVSSWGEDERAFRVGPDVTLAMGDAALEAERTPQGTVRVIAVRGDVGWRSSDHQGRLEQGESLEGPRGAPAVHAAGVWDDWTGGAASSQGAARRGSQGVGEAVMHGAPGDAPVELAVNEHRVDVVVEGDLAFTTVTQRFFNGSDAVQPVEYRVRIPDDALVSGFAAGAGDALVDAAPASVASLAGPGAGTNALLARPDGSLYASLATIAPGGSLRCRLQYVQWLGHAAGRRTYVYPMGDPVSPPFVGEFAFSLTATRANVDALRAPTGAQVDASHVTWGRSDFRPRADFAVDLVDRAQPASPSARLWLSPNDSLERYMLADVDLPAATMHATDVVVLLDDSAGMDTGTLTTASAAVDALMHTLGPDDRVALMFGDLAGRPAAGSAGQFGAVNDTHREEVLEAIAHARPGGATNLSRMLSDAYARLDPSRNGVVLYLGDGQPTMGVMDPQRVFDETLRAAPDLRLYAITLGAETQPDVLRRLTARGGLLRDVDDQSQAVLAAQTIAAHAVRPVLRDVVVHLGNAMGHPLPESIELHVAGEPLHVMGELTGPVPPTVTVDARDGTQMHHWSMTPRVDTVHDQGDIRRRWGAARIAALQDVGVSDAALADLGVRFGLVTPMSALVLGVPGSMPDAQGVVVSSSAWPLVWTESRLPHLGLADDVAPRGVRAMFTAPEFAMLTDEDDGWQRHAVGEGGSSGPQTALSRALATADDAARACFERARSFRPSLSGTVTVQAMVDASGHLSSVAIVSDGVGDANTASCIRRAVAGLVLPAPSVLGINPGSVSRTFDFTHVTPVASRRTCPPSSRLDREARRVLWQERIATHPGDATTVWTDATTRCELRLWEDRAALLDLLVRSANGPEELIALRTVLDTDGAKYFERIAARRWGPTRVWRAYVASQGEIDWDALVRLLEDPHVPLDRRIAATEGYHLLVPDDVDTRLRLMSLYEQAGRVREARHVGDELRADPYADARVRSLVGEMLIRTHATDEGLRAFSEIAEFAPYDTHARRELGDMLLTYGGEEWAGEAYLQYQTLAMLEPGDPGARVRMALAATMAHREDEALRLLRSVAEDSGGDATAPSVEALLVGQIARLSAQRGDDPAVRAWTRVARLTDIARQGGVVARWTHPDASLELRAQAAGDNAFVTVGATSPWHVSVFSPGTALEGSRVLLRANDGIAGARQVGATIELIEPTASGPHLLEQTVTLDATHRVVSFLVEHGALVPDPRPVPASEQPTTPVAAW